VAVAKDVAQVRIKNAIPQEDQLLWTFSLNDARTKLFWEHAREFEYKGEMYDVIRSETKGDSVSYWCYWDRKETRLKKQLNVLVMKMMGPGPQSKNNGTRINDFFRSLFFQDTAYVDEVAFHLSQNRCNTAYRFSLSLHDTIPLSPPPDVS
jgi:hypothetical protein